MTQGEKNFPFSNCWVAQKIEYKAMWLAFSDFIHYLSQIITKFKCLVHYVSNVHCVSNVVGQWSRSWRENRFSYHLSVYGFKYLRLAVSEFSSKWPNYVITLVREYIWTSVVAGIVADAKINVTLWTFRIPIFWLAALSLMTVSANIFNFDCMTSSDDTFFLNSHRRANEIPIMLLTRDTPQQRYNGWRLLNTTCVTVISGQSQV